MLGINLKVMVFWACCCKIQEEMRAEARKTCDYFRTRKKIQKTSFEGCKNYLVTWKVPSYSSHLVT